ncbi:MAG: hypothetical protein ACRDJE_28720 [Dehalococcoidia bacterium]
MTTKEQILQAIADLPDETTFEEAIERLAFLAKLHRRLQELDAGVAISDEEAHHRLREWLA